MTNTLHSDNETLVTTAHPFVGLSNGEERFAKVQLAHQINLLIKERSLGMRIKQYRQYDDCASSKDGQS